MDGCLVIDVRNIRAASKWRGRVRWVVRRLVDLLLAGLVVGFIIIGIPALINCILK